ncbi:MAG: DEAD/DEAH box helicase, partial [Gemmatimonadaceae bacterium]
MKQTTKPARWTTVPVHTVCAQIASAALGEKPPLDVQGEVAATHGADLSDAIPPDVTLGSITLGSITLGSITLRLHQADAVQRIRASIRAVGGALLADDVGLGKTYVALALAREYARAHVIAPATLLPMWRDAVAATGVSNVVLHSVQALSRRPISAEQNEGSMLIIVDEAHHLRTRNTVRYRNAQQFSAGRDILLMSATPVHNRTRELRNLLALFLGHRVDALDRATLAECVIRRTSSDAESIVVPRVHEHDATFMPDNRAVLECILQLAPPLPVNDGAAASALVRLGLLRAWCSSDAALTDRIRRRQLRGEALLHSLAHGRYPTQRELEAWIVGSDSVQLGFPELLIATASDDTSVLLKTLVSHLDSLQALLQVHTRTSIADASRSSALRAMLQNESPTPIIAFSQFASTVRALHRALSDMAGVASLTSEGGRIASGPIARQELIANFAPKANGRPPPSDARKIRLLITTDLLAEGVNLQDAGTVVHLDLPWTHALKQQRVGRVARMGSSFSVVHVYTFAPPMGAESALKLVATLERKAGLHRDLVGYERGITGLHNDSTASAPDEATQLRNALMKWRSNGVAAPLLSQSLHPSSSPSLMSTQRPTARPTPALLPTPTLVAVTRAAQSGWIAVVESNSESLVVACLNSATTELLESESHSQETREHVDSDTTTLLRAVRAVDDARSEAIQVALRDPDIKPEKHGVQHALKTLNSWLYKRDLQNLAGDTPRSISRAQKRALDTLSLRLHDTSAARRFALATLASSI